MTQSELTQSVLSRYDGYMSASGTTYEQGASQPQPLEGGVRPAPVIEHTAAGRSLLENRGEERDVAPPEARRSAEQDAAKAAEDASKSPTRQRLIEISQEVVRTANPKDIIGAYRQVAGWAVLVDRALKDEGERKKLEPILQQIKNIGDALQQGSGQLQDMYHITNNSAGLQAILSQRASIADGAQRLKEYFEKERLIERQDYFKPITSFEEFMIKIADFTTKDEFRPGGKRQLLEIEEKYDEFGRKIITEKAHPENFIYWMRDQMWFFHDFSPITNISLFQDIAIPTASRAVSLGEILYGATSDTFFSHRVPKIDEIIMSPTELMSIKKRDPNKFHVEMPDENGKGGKYIVTDEDGTQKVFSLRPAARPSHDGQYLIEGYNLIDEKGEVMYGVDLEKDAWNTEKNEGYNRAKNDVLWEAFLLTNFHNYSVMYRTQAMPSEEPLKEKMAEIYGLNMMTDSRERLLRLLRMQSTEKEDEAQDRLDNDHHKQGSVGKAMQRCLAGYYHSAEASAAANGYNFEKDEKGRFVNAFVEAMRGENVRGSDEFYKGLVNLTFENEFGQEIAGIKELVDRLNAQKIKGRYNKKTNAFVDDWSGEALRDRNDWEKVQISEVAFLGRSELLQVLREQYHISSEDFNQVLYRLTNDLQNGYIDSQGKKHAADTQKLDQLQKIGNKEAVLRLLVGKKKVSEDLFAPAGYMRQFIDGGWGKLDLFAVKFLAQTFANSKEGGFTDDANIWSNISYDHRAAKRVRQAMRHAVSHTERLNDFEALYAEEWAYSLVFQTGISARNDMGGIGHDAWSKIINTEFYRLRQSGGGNYVGNYENLYGMHRLGVNFWEGIKVQREDGKLDTTLYEVITGLRNNNGMMSFDINADIGTFDFYGNAERQFYADHMSHAIDLFIDLTKKHEFNFNNIVSEDSLGRVIINHVEMQKMVDTTWKHLRYAFDNRGFLYDNTLYNWWYDENIDKDGKISRKPRFGFKTLRDFMFGHEVQEFGMYGHLDEHGDYIPGRKDVSSWTGENVYHTKMGRNVLAYFIKAQIEEHTKARGDATIYSADQIAYIAKEFSLWASRVMKGEHGEAIVLAGFFNSEEMYKILLAAHATLLKLYMQEYGADFGGGFLSFFFETMRIIMKEAGAGISLGK